MKQLFHNGVQNWWFLSYISQQIKILLEGREGAALDTAVKIDEKQPKCPSIDVWITKCAIYIYAMEYDSAIKKKKKGNSALYDNMDRLQGHYTKWEKSDKERQILYVDLTYV